MTKEQRAAIDAILHLLDACTAEIENEEAGVGTVEEAAVDLRIAWGEMTIDQQEQLRAALYGLIRDE